MVLWAGGCGTVCNFATGNPKFYGGLETDAKTISHLGPLQSEQGGADAKGPLFILGFTAAELTATATGDTLTLPLVALYHSKENRKNKEDQINQSNLYPGKPQYSAGLQVLNGDAYPSLPLPELNTVTQFPLDKVDWP
jgi:hypothetical protein